MAVYTLFGQAGGDALIVDGTGYSLGMQFTLSQDAALTGIWFYSAAGAAALPAACVVFQQAGAGTGTVVTGSENDVPSWSGAAGSGWVKCTYDGTVTLTAAAVYKVCVEKQPGVDVYSATGAYWTSGPGASGLTSGIITAPNSAGADGGQDSYVTGVSWPAYPIAGGGANYWIDVEVTAGGTDAAVTLGSALAATAAQAAAQVMSLDGPAYAATAADLGGGAGSWVNAGNADGTPDGSFATWTAP